jgi:hypothetical protein
MIKKKIERIEPGLNWLIITKTAYEFLDGKFCEISHNIYIPDFIRRF